MLRPSVSFVICSLAACACNAGTHARASSDKVAPTLPERGDDVVLEPTAGAFVAGRVLSRDGTQLRVQPVDAQRSVRVAVDDVYLPSLPVNSPPIGGFGVCSPAPQRWVGCKVLAASDRELSVQLLAGGTRQLARSQVLTPSPITALNLHRTFQLAERRLQFEIAVQNAGVPEVPLGWQMKVDEPVVGKRHSGWYSARIRAIDEEDVSLRWLGDHGVSTVAREAIVPEPPQAQALDRGGFALLRPRNHGEPWQPVRILVSLPGEVVVSDSEENRRSASPRDLLPLKVSARASESPPRP